MLSRLLNFFMRAETSNSNLLRMYRVERMWYFLCPPTSQCLNQALPSVDINHRRHPTSDQTTTTIHDHQSSKCPSTIYSTFLAHKHCTSASLSSLSWTFLFPALSPTSNTPLHPHTSPSSLPSSATTPTLPLTFLKETSCLCPMSRADAPSYSFSIFTFYQPVASRWSRSGQQGGNKGLGIGQTRWWFKEAGDEVWCGPIVGTRRMCLGEYGGESLHEERAMPGMITTWVNGVRGKTGRSMLYKHNWDVWYQGMSDAHVSIDQGQLIIKGIAEGRVAVHMGSKRRKWDLDECVRVQFQFYHFWELTTFTPAPPACASLSPAIFIIALDFNSFLQAPEHYNFTSWSSDEVITSMLFPDEKRLVETMWARRSPLALIAKSSASNSQCYAKQAGFTKILSGKSIYRFNKFWLFGLNQMERFGCCKWEALPDVA